MKKIVVPVELQQTIARFRNDRISGQVALNFDAGKLRSIKITEHRPVVTGGSHYPNEHK